MLTKPEILTKQPDPNFTAEQKASFESHRRDAALEWDSTLINAQTSELTPALQVELAGAIKRQIARLKERGEWQQF